MQNLYAKMSVTLIFMANYILITAFAPASVLNPRLGAFRNWNGLLRNLKRTCLVTKTATSWWLACSSDLGFIRDAQRQKCFSVWPAWWVTFRALWGSSKKAMKYLSNLKLHDESDLEFQRFCFASVCDWSRKLAPLSQSIRFKAKTNYGLVTRVLSPLREFACCHTEFLLDSFAAVFWSR